MNRPVTQAQIHESYWDALCEDYRDATRISLDAFHVGPLLPSGEELGLFQRDFHGAQCLELGCGAGQNSIVLAKKGAHCTALDISQNMLNWGRALNLEAGTQVNFVHASMDALPDFATSFDFIHSSYGVPFADNPETVIAQCAGLLKPGGELLISMGHPVYAGEWLDLDEGEQGIFLKDYFHPLEDERADEAGEAVARSYPISTVCEWLIGSGLELRRVLEPSALPVHTMRPADIERDVPYYSEGWAEQVRELMRFPIVLVLLARKPD